MTVASTLSLTGFALAIDAAIGYPQLLFDRIGHPVTWMGALIAATDVRLNRDGASQGRRRILGVASLLLWLILAGGIAGVVTWLSSGTIPGFIFLTCLAATLPAQRSLHDHVKTVSEALETKGIEAGRTAVGMIVGRETSVLDEAGVARAAIESLAENFSDGVVAPAFWLAVAGLPGGALYKTINTADSMVGHRTPRHEAFGWAAARLDDLVNLPASRLAAVWLVLAALPEGAGVAGRALRCIRRDALHHRSPNAGWPEAAMAGVLGLKLAGPRLYAEGMVDDAYMGDGRREATAGDIRRALKLYRRACIIQVIVVACFALLFSART